MRVNEKLPEQTFKLPARCDRAAKQVRGKGFSGKRERPEGEALPPHPDLTWRKRPAYRTGDGEIPVYIRPGSDHSHIKSFGSKT